MYIYDYVLGPHAENVELVMEADDTWGYVNSLSKVGVMAVLAHQGKWSDIETALTTLVHGSKFGAKLFASATQQDLGECVTRKIAEV